jgi:Methyltransferase domain
MTRLNGPALVASDYASEDRLRRRAAAFTSGAKTIDEVGCGWGELAEWIAREAGAEVTAVDLSPRMVAPFGDGAFDGSGPSPSTFTRENCEDLVGRHFAHVRREAVDGRIEFATRRDVEEYVRASISISPFVGNLPAVVHEPFRARRAVSIFVADKAG